MEGKQFKKAIKLYRRKKYTGVIQILEPQVFRFRESFTFFHLLGMSCLHVGDIGGAFSYLNRAHDLNPKDINTLLGLAVVYLRKQDTQKALSTWFMVLDIDPNNKTAQKGLKFLKKYADTEDLQTLQDTSKLVRIMPSVKFKHFNLLSPLIGVIILTIFVSAGLYLYRTGFLENKGPQREGIENFNISGRPDIDQVDAAYQLSEKDLKHLLIEIKDDFNHFNDNHARLLINKILLSNADEKVKKQMTVLKGYLKEPTFSTLNTDFSYREVLKEPLLYEDCFVNWRGSVSNLVITEDSISFDLLVGYENGKILEGIVPVILDFAVKVDPSLPVEVLGKIVFSDDKLYLKGISIHQFIKDIK